MATRGTLGFYKNGITKGIYSSSDSYISCLGERIVKFINSLHHEVLDNIFDNLTPVTIDGYYISGGDLYELYNAIDYKLYYLNYDEFIKDSSMCEYAYIINLDDNLLEVYEGFQKEHSNNRYTDFNNHYEMKECKLIESFKLGEHIPEIVFAKKLGMDVDDSKERLAEELDEVIRKYGYKVNYTIE